MAKKPGKRKQKKHLQQQQDDVDEKDLDRFAGSSDEEDGDEKEGEQQVHLAPPSLDDEEIFQDVEDDTEDDDSDNIGKGDEFIQNHCDAAEDDDDSSVSSIEKEADPGFKMASVMGRILAGDDKKRKAPTSSVVLGKTITPLQKLQQQEKEKLKARQANRERNLTAMHYPLSIATSNNVHTEERLSVAKELEQERFHRRVATRGVVALFNAISQHQRSNNAQVSRYRLIHRWS